MPRECPVSAAGTPRVRRGHRECGGDTVSAAGPTGPAGLARPGRLQRGAGPGSGGSAESGERLRGRGSASPRERVGQRREEWSGRYRSRSPGLRFCLLDLGKNLCHVPLGTDRGRGAPSDRCDGREVSKGYPQFHCPAELRWVRERCPTKGCCAEPTSAVGQSHVRGKVAGQPPCCLEVC